MSILVIWSSPNRDGLTATAKDKILEGLALSKTTTEVIHLNRCDIKSCHACGDGWGLCRSEGQCVVNDDFTSLYQKLTVADGIVWITPVYWHDLSECLKSFLDRLRRCETGHNHSLKSKKCLLVACAGGTGLGAIECLHNMEETLRHMGMECVDRLPIIRFNQQYMLPALTGAGQAFGSELTT